MAIATICPWLVLLAVIVCVMAEDEKYRVVVQHGALQGHGLISRRGREFAGFQAIPYAKPPVGDLRFKGPQPPDSWYGVRDATVDSSICPQKNNLLGNQEIQGHEDCLYLNVYTPVVRIPDDVSDRTLDVMFWIHGGGWIAGSGTSLSFGPTYLLDKDIVLVTFNYRLGPLGFLSTGDEVSPGNFGLKDHVAALRWVRDNIAAFGGNPDSVTIFGESVGGTGVHYLMMSPMGQGLFHRAISQSGTAFSSWAFPFNGTTRNNALKLAALVNCPTDSSLKMVQCLRETHVADIINTDSYFTVISIKIPETKHTIRFLLGSENGVIQLHEDQPVIPGPLGHPGFPHISYSYFAILFLLALQTNH